MRFSPESLEIKVVISRNVFLFKVMKSWGCLSLYEKARSISSNQIISSNQTSTCQQPQIIGVESTLSKEKF